MKADIVRMRSGRIVDLPKAGEGVVGIRFDFEKVVQTVDLQFVAIVGRSDQPSYMKRHHAYWDAAAFSKYHRACLDETNKAQDGWAAAVAKEAATKLGAGTYHKLSDAAHSKRIKQIREMIKMMIKRTRTSYWQKGQ